MSTSRSLAAVAILLAHGFFIACAPPDEPPRAHWTDVTDSTEVRILRESESLCEDCITLERVLVMGDTIGEGYLREAMHMVRDSAGNYWFGQYEAVKVFDATGNFVGEVGRAGEGPMEWQIAMPVHTDRQGRVHIFDNGNYRHSVIGPDFSLLDEERLPLGREVRVLGDGEGWVVNAWSQAPEQRYQPLHVLEGEDVVRSFGGTLDFADDRVAEMESWRVFTADSAHRVFSSPWYSQEIEVWGEDGARITGFTNPAFNGPSFDRFQMQPDDPPPNTMRALRIDAADRLWVLSWQLRDDWLDMMEERRSPDGRVTLEMKPGLATMDRFDGQIDVIDMTTATVIARTRMEGVIVVDFLGDDALWAGEYAGAGHLRVGIWEIGFTP
ncbi:MAG: hypothetical protein OXH08_10020 [Gammaproteobacteria bacterium]|nr:hypothetical protein [Gammaproteobacteria bacterium]MDE0649961.1 hypothetical protein [Gammaproteobacteria bacterium]MXW10701.1 hypothetical protein [Gammaproteobacteria bacterium]MYC51130.1 hypothetical protein [Gammaproteobacteria bacterium]